MNSIVTDLYKILKSTRSLIEAEEKIQKYMYEVISTFMGEVLTNINQVIKEKKQFEGWSVKRSDPKSIQFSFGLVTFQHTLMSDEKGKNHYPLDEWLGLRSRQRISPLVELKVAELASQSTYREAAKILEDWTPVNISHQTVGRIVKQVGAAQAQADQEMVKMLDEAEELPEGKKVDFYFAEADGVFVHKTERKKSIEVHHAIMYEGWEVNGKRVSLENPMYVLTTKSISKFWDEVQAKAASQYSLEEAHVITNSDGGKGYGSERFQEAFSQSNHPVLTQLDSYHINQALNRALGVKSNEFKRGIQEAIKEHNREAFNQWLDTYESTLEDSKQIKKVQEFRKYILGNWERIFDWRDNFENLPENSRGLGAMESNQRHISYRMKKRGMHWSPEGAEAMVKVKQGILNHTLRDAYLSQQTRSTRKQRESRKIVRISSLLHQKTRPSIGAKQGSVPLYTANSSAMGVLKRNLQ